MIVLRKHNTTFIHKENIMNYSKDAWWFIEPREGHKHELSIQEILKLFPNGILVENFLNKTDLEGETHEVVKVSRMVAFQIESSPFGLHRQFKIYIQRPGNMRMSRYYPRNTPNSSPKHPEGSIAKMLIGEGVLNLKRD